MLKKIQYNLLTKKPLLWNIKVVPLTLILVITNLLFLIIGYANGSIDFTETDDNYSSDNDDSIVFFAVLISLITCILWLVYYFKNNAFKSFYPKTKFALYKEWLAILSICFLSSTMITAYFYGKDLKRRSYFTEEEAKRRCGILSQGSFFIDGAYDNHYEDYEEDTTAISAEIASNEPVSKNINKDYFYFRGKKYSKSSLLNKDINSYTFFDQDSDSLRALKIKNWLFENKKDSIKKILNSYLKIVHEHNLKTNIDADKWLKLIYDYPTYENYIDVGKKEFELVYDYYERENDDTNKIDTTEQYYKKIDNKIYLYNKYYVPEENLNHSYDKIAESWTNPSANFTTFLISLYFALFMSMIIFSFRVTSGRNWLICFISLGVLNIILGIFTMVSGTNNVFLILQFIVFLLLLVYFISIISKNKGKEISGITLVALLWMLPAFGIILYQLIYEIAKEATDYNYIGTINQHPFVKFLRDNDFELMWVNVIFVFIVMAFLTQFIKKWRGIAEN